MKKTLYAFVILTTLFVSGCASNVQDAKFIGLENRSIQVSGGSKLYNSGCIANMLFIGFGCYSYTVANN